MPKRTFKGSKRKNKKKHGFLGRKKRGTDKSVTSRRRKGRTRLSASDK